MLIPFEWVKESVDCLNHLVVDAFNRKLVNWEENASLSLLDIAWLVVRIMCHLHFQVHLLTVYCVLAHPSKLDKLTSKSFTALVFFLSYLCVDNLEVLAGFIDHEFCCITVPKWLNATTCLISVEPVEIVLFPQNNIPASSLEVNRTLVAVCTHVSFNLESWPIFSLRQIIKLNSLWSYC